MGVFYSNDPPSSIIWAGNRGFHVSILFNSDSDRLALLILFLACVFRWKAVVKARSETLGGLSRNVRHLGPMSSSASLYLIVAMLATREIMQPILRVKVSGGINVVYLRGSR